MGINRGKTGVLLEFVEFACILDFIGGTFVDLLIN